MFVRWKKRKCTGKNRSRLINYYLDAVLVENYRDGEKVKQRFIKHLGSVGDNDGPIAKSVFWRDVIKRLDILNLEESEREKIKKKIMERVSIPTQEEKDKQMEGLKKYL